MIGMPHLHNVMRAVLSSVVIAACSPVAAFPGQAAPTSQVERAGNSLTGRIDAILARELLPVTGAGIKVISLKTGETIYESNPRLLLVPASTQKLFTAAAALSILGPDREVTTTVALDAAEGKVYLKGCGDGLLSAADLSALAATAATRMDRGREYGLAADLSCFDDLYRGKGWMWDDDEPLISALSVNQNLVTLLIRPGPKPGAPAVVTAEPATSYFTIENVTKTGPGNEPSSVQAARRPDERDNIVTVSGAIPLGSAPLVKHASVWRPEFMALTLFGDALRAQGVNVTSLTTAPIPAGATELARLSRRVEELARFALKTSDNVTAESLLKLLGLHKTGVPGTAEAGSAAVRRYLETHGIATANVVVADGSGLSRYNLTSAETMTKTLQAIYEDRELYRIFRESLPIAGRDGTLKNRMKGSCAEGNLRGKTGNMKGVSALTGFVDSADGEPLAFSMIIQNYAGSGWLAREVQDRISTLLCSFRRHPHHPSEQ